MHADRRALSGDGVALSDLVTGEAVVLELRLARLASRAVALALDLLVQFFLFFVGALAFGLIGPSLDATLFAALWIGWTVAILFGYPVTFETLTRGRSLGKMALGLRVVRDDGGPIRFRHALMRGLGGMVDFYATSGSAALITSLANSRGKRLGDLMAGTVVLRERMPLQGGPVAQMPPWLAGWAGTLDVSRIPDDLALAVRQFLARVPQLDAGVRASMGGRLVQAVQQATGSYPPPGVLPGDYLSAVLAERRRRELVRMNPAAVGQPHWGSVPPPAWGAPAQPRAPLPPVAPSPRPTVPPPSERGDVDGFHVPG